MFDFLPQAFVFQVLQGHLKTKLFLNLTSPIHFLKNHLIFTQGFNFLFGLNLISFFEI